MPSIYENNRYSAEVRRWVDGDTVELHVDLGQGVIANGHYRLYGIDAPETTLRGDTTQEEKAAGLALKERLNLLWPRGTEVVVSTKKSSGKYGRFLVTIWANLEGEEVNVNEWLLSEGWVRLY